MRRSLRSFLRLWRAWRNRLAVRNLAEFDDRTLKDIGLTRSDVDGALAEPLFRDPSIALALKVHDQQAAARRLAADGLRTVAVSRPQQRPATGRCRAGAPAACAS
ncbi:DUF1127 domain-containing protein [Chelatococcus sp. SYSU_G07232]|uniref:DUF1127 domain-containing protein n=1 Tax=Chelatococcus albus TaxID=3047466 RepID=A0ABT7AM38_9HYPH|nr:DUF1127 domain-containing protein [Chelatococcus sp. SYSU_G07232]MDJ1160012.1 DUF1127 domain-containing protein [Chelatococcus sp. SYSU_G07232]